MKNKLKQIFQIYGTLNKYIIFNFVQRNLKLKYRKSFFGVFWTVLVPAFTALIYFFVFNFVLKVKIDNYLLFVLVGIIPWTFFAGSLQQAVESIVANQNILNKVPVPSFVFPLSEVITQLINLFLAFPVIIVVYVFYRITPELPLLQVFPLLLLLFLQAYSLGIIGAIGFVYLRDLRFIINILLQAWFYLTPVLYEIPMIPEPYRGIVYLNPVGSLFHGLHEAVVMNRWIDSSHLLTSVGWTAILMVISNLVYFRNKKTIVENL